VLHAKDVIDRDKAEVPKRYFISSSECSLQRNTSRFALKLQKIVQDEGDDNFITRLHAGKFQIVPWPVIGSRDFYKLFDALQKKLDQESTLYRTASEFLFTLKTLMAKLKVRAISSSAPPHRQFLHVH
jgi:hypothetical protein